ncbi:MAG: hypothetical protein WAM65_19930, partial [Candidatus Korobacteraceae bacterium]
MKGRGFSRADRHRLDGGILRLCRYRKTNFVVEQTPKQPIKLAAQRRDGVRRGRQPTLEVGETRAA